MSLERVTVPEPIWHATVAAAPEPLPPGFEPQLPAAGEPDEAAAAALVTLHRSPIRCTALIGHGDTGTLMYATVGAEVSVGLVRTLLRSPNAEMAPRDGVEVVVSQVGDLASMLLSGLPRPPFEWVGGESGEAARRSLDTITADASISIEGRGNVPMLLRLLLGARGWVSLGLEGERVTNTPLTVASLENLLGGELSAALGRALLATDTTG